MGIITWIIFGALAGWVTGLVTGTSDRRGCIGNIILGIVGALLGGFLMSLVIPGGKFGIGFNLVSFLVAVIGSILVLVLTGVLRNR